MFKMQYVSYYRAQIIKMIQKTLTYKASDTETIRLSFCVMLLRTHTLGFVHCLVSRWQEISIRVQKQSGKHILIASLRFLCIISFLDLICGIVKFAVVFPDLLVGSSHRQADWKDFDRTYKVDHLAVLGTSPSVGFVFFSSSIKF